MATCTDQIEILSNDFADQQPLWFPMALPMVLPISDQRVVLVAQRQGCASFQKQDQLAKLLSVLATLPGEFTSRRNWFPGTRLRPDLDP